MDENASQIEPLVCVESSVDGGFYEVVLLYDANVDCERTMVFRSKTQPADGPEGHASSSIRIIATLVSENDPSRINRRIHLANSTE